MSEAANGQSVGLKRVHVLPLGADTSANRLESVKFILSSRVNCALTVGEMYSDAAGGRFVIAKTEPESGGKLVPDSDFYVDGPPVSELRKVQLTALLGPTDEISGDSLFETDIGPYIQSKVGINRGIPVYTNQVITVGSLRYVVSALESITSSSSLGLITLNTLIYVNCETSGNFDRIHILPFQDTLPRVYEFDVFEDYLRPYFLLNPLALFSANTQFVFQSVQFKVVCVDPSDGRPRRIGPNTLIHCEGLLHSSLRNLLPPELLEQLSSLPPGLQMLLINTELLSSTDVLDRFMDLQETLAHRRGLSEEALAGIPVEVFEPSASSRPESHTQCMICLSEFEQGERLRRLPCAHVYHQPCIDEWLQRCPECPLCKTNVQRAMNSQ